MVVPGAFFPVGNAPEKTKPQGKDRQAIADKAQKGQTRRYFSAIDPHHLEAHEHLAKGLSLPAVQRQKIYGDKQGKGQQEQEQAEEDGGNQDEPVWGMHPHGQGRRAQAAEIEQVDQEDVDAQGHPAG